MDFSDWLSILAVVISAGTLCLAYMQSPLSRWLSPKLTYLPAYFCEYKGGFAESYVTCSITNEGKRKAENVYVAVDAFTSECDVQVTDYPFSILNQDRGHVLIRLDMIPSGATATVSVSSKIDLRSDGVSDAIRRSGGDSLAPTISRVYTEYSNALPEPTKAMSGISVDQESGEILVALRLEDGSKG